MNAVEFVKKFGLGKVIELLNRIESETEFLLNYSDTYLYPVQLKSDWCHEDEFSQYCESELYWVSRSMGKDDEDINDYWFASVLELKQIVDAFELVERSGGLVACRNTINTMDSISSDKNGLIYKPFAEAVSLVEQCK